MSRQLNIATLDAAAEDYAGAFLLPSTFSKINSHMAIGGQEWVLQNLFNIHFMDEHDYLVNAIKGELGVKALARFEAEAAERFSPREDSVFAALLAEKLAIDPDGNHIPGKIGTVQFGSRDVGQRITRHGKQGAYWPVYAGEEEERALGHVREPGKDGPGTDPLPPESTMWMSELDHMGGPTELFTLVTNVSIAFAQASLDAGLALLDEGSVAGFINGREGTQPVDPNAAESGVLLFSLTLTTPNPFGSATDAAPDALGTAATITDDTTADATNTLNYCRGNSSNSLFTPLNPHIDGHADTSGGDFNFNTLAIVSGATVSMTAWTVTLPQGPTAT